MGWGKNCRIYELNSAFKNFIFIKKYHIYHN